MDNCKHDWWGIGICERTLFVECSVGPCRATGTVELSQQELDKFGNYPYLQFRDSLSRVIISTPDK